MVILRLVFFGMTSVLFQDVVELQADIGLGLLVVALVLQYIFKPYATKGLNTIEETSVLTLWFTLFGGSLLFSKQTSTVVKTVSCDLERSFSLSLSLSLTPNPQQIVTIFIFVGNVSFFAFLAYRLGKKLDVEVIEGYRSKM